jgi:hypothetical protein
LLRFSRPGDGEIAGYDRAARKTAVQTQKSDAVRSSAETELAGFRQVFYAGLKQLR